MTGDFTPRLDILPPPQRRLWDELAAVPAEFVLYGGTALALHLGHRQSVDFDFFGNRPLDAALLVPAIPFLAGATVTQRAPNLFSPQDTLKALSYFEDGNLRRLAQPVRDRLARAAREVDLDRLPVIAATRGGADHDPSGAQ